MSTHISDQMVADMQQYLGIGAHASPKYRYDVAYGTILQASIQEAGLEWDDVVQAAHDATGVRLPYVD